jgi:mannose-6-phosphate isomerase-like protein (cupin superfamily)
VHVIRGLPQRAIDQYGSDRFIHSRIARGEVDVSVAELAGTIGGHPAAARQLFVVLRGRVHVRTGDESVDLEPHDAALWEPGEWHESHALEPSLVLIVQGEFDPPG